MYGLVTPWHSLGIVSSNSGISKVLKRLVKFVFVVCTMYSLLNSHSAKASSLSSQESLKAVRIGSLLERDINEGLARAR